ncbi:RTA1 domain protein [Aspergillus heteromorphus CBS 117.55]|uniref:RTA1 domain protein n=1 Tax=Aspergillus heteromorphus CBS 117.55 TaxID=1448321 RepID=A0A317X626_9EURO|nr:RTA1 domain protein [Aspergillus heteromorphus CBS 117.55]PWY92368.1 RTA1 domain protein [Aspergillus heteromorphus CBS 117.55]
MAHLEPLAGGYYLWKYLPSITAAAIFAVLFGGITCVHCFKLWRTRAWFNVPFVVGGAFEFIGYIFRIVCYNNTASITSYSVQSVLILLAPVLYAASVYMTLGRIIRSIHAEELSVVPVSWLTRLFVISDIVAFWVQGGGAGLMVMQNMATVSKVIVIVGLVIQMAMFSFFIVTSVVFYRRAQQIPPTAGGVPWRQHMNTLFAVSGFILIRSIYRVVEYTMGMDGYFLTHEWPLYVFDAVLMWLVMVIWAIKYPGQIEPGKTEMELLSTEDAVSG